MIHAKRNQPVAFAESLAQVPAVLNMDPAVPLLLRTSDPLTFQLGLSVGPSEVGKFADPTFATANWAASIGWTLADTLACLDGSLASFLNETTFNPTPGNTYSVQVEVLSMEQPGSLTVSFGGVTEELTGPGSYELIITATNAGGLVFIPGTAPGSSALTPVCLTFAQVYDYPGTVTLTVKDANDATVATRTTVANPGSWTVTPGALTFTEELAALSLANGCYTLQVTDTEGTTLTSQEIRQGAHPDTLVLSGCNTSDSAGISFEGSMFRPTLRVRAVLSRPRFTFDFGDTRFSNGERERHYAKRERVQTLRIERIGEPEAEALAAMALWDRFYIGQVEHVITSDELAQDTADLWELVGGVTLDVAPRVDPAVKIRTTAEVATCTPPPNYLVEGTGPNDNYVYQENGDRFLLNN